MKVHESIAEVVRVLSRRHPAYGLVGLAMMLSALTFIAALSRHSVVVLWRM